MGRPAVGFSCSRNVLLRTSGIGQLKVVQLTPIPTGTMAFRLLPVECACLDRGRYKKPSATHRFPNLSSSQTNIYLSSYPGCLVRSWLLHFDDPTHHDCLVSAAPPPPSSVTLLNNRNVSDICAVSNADYSLSSQISRRKAGTPPLLVTKSLPKVYRPKRSGLFGARVRILRSTQNLENI